MSLSAVYLTHDLRMACLQLALSTEKEEIIGLLLGEVGMIHSINLAY